MAEHRPAGRLDERAQVFAFGVGALELFDDAPITGYVPLILPIAVQELVPAGRLLVHGFDPSPSGSADIRPSGVG